MRGVPKPWSETIETHRRAVQESILDAAAALVADQGLRDVTMSEIAEKSGIGRATLYKYVPDVETMLLAWHERQVGWSSRSSRRAENRRSAPKADTRARIVAAALEIFRDRGLAGASNLAIARAADVAPATVRNHFREPGELAQAVFEALLVIGPPTFFALRDRALSSDEAVRLTLELTVPWLEARQDLLARGR